MKAAKYFLSFIMMLSIMTFSQAQTGSEEIPFGDLPPTPEFGKCFAKCKMPDRYDWIEKQELVKEASSKYEIIPAVYETRTERVMVKEASTRQIPVPAVYTSVTEQVVVKEAGTKVIEVPATYRTDSNREMVEAPRGEWIRKKKDQNCFSDNPEDCYILCWEEKPAVYRTVQKQVLVTAAEIQTIDIPADYKSITKRVLKTPASVRVEQIPAEYNTVTKRVLVTPAQKREIVIPAVFRTDREKRLISKGGYTEWTEILCAAKTTTVVVRDVQRALKTKGYNPGPVDGVMGIQTQAALRQYQKDKELPQGNLNLQTLQSLGVQNG